MDFANELKKIRTTRNIYQKDLAEMINRDQQYISNLERGVIEPNLSMLIKLADVFGCSIDYLLGRESEDSMIVIEGEKVIPEIGPADRIYNQLTEKNKFRFLSYGQGLLDGQGK
ncbi:MAG: helix-turn-helix domain-containing protein [Christensenellales bacterium]